jgi:hypothetical protein
MESPIKNKPWSHGVYDDSIKAVLKVNVDQFPRVPDALRAINTVALEMWPPQTGKRKLKRCLCHPTEIACDETQKV